MADGLTSSSDAALVQRKGGGRVEKSTEEKVYVM